MECEVMIRCNQDFASFTARTDVRENGVLTVRMAECVPIVEHPTPTIYDETLEAGA